MGEINKQAKSTINSTSSVRHHLPSAALCMVGALRHSTIETNDIVYYIPAPGALSLTGPGVLSRVYSSRCLLDFPLPGAMWRPEHEKGRTSR